MRTAVKTTAFVGVAGAVLAALLAAPAAARDSRAAAADRWIPSFALVGGITVQQYSGGFSSTCADGGPGDPYVNPAEQGSGIVSCIGLGKAIPSNQIPGNLPQGTRKWQGMPLGGPNRLASRGPGLWGIGGEAPLRPAEDGEELGLSPFIAANLELLTPAIEAIPGGPRLFVSGEVQFLFPPTYKVANEGDPVGAFLREPFTFEGLSALALNGVGSEVTAEVQLVGWGASLGIAFPFEFRGHTIWVKPGAAWTQYQVEVQGRVAAGLKDDCCPLTINGWGPNLRSVDLAAGTTKIFNGVGPSLEFEMDVGRFGPLGISIFLGGAMYRVLGDRKIDLTDSVSYPFLARSIFIVTLPADTYTANWSLEVDPWMYRSNVGIRFHWLGR